MKIQKMLDWAKIDGNTADFGKLKRGGYDVVGLRRSACYWDGSKWTMFVDDTYKTEAPRARAAGVTVIMYDFGIYAAGAPSPEAQFNVSDAAGAFVAGVDLPPCVDFEWESFRHLLQPAEDVCKLLAKHVDLRRAKYGCATVYTSANELYDLGNPSLPEVGGIQSVCWAKTAYPVGAGQPPWSRPLAQPHAGDAASDPHGYYLVPKPWPCARMQQTQGDARYIDGLSHQGDLGRFFASERGDAGPLVVEVQALLNANHGASLAVDGGFGALTDGVVRTVQAKYHLPQTGVVDAATYARIACPVAQQ